MPVKSPTTAGELQEMNAEQQRVAVVLAGMQRDIGDTTVALATMQRDVTDQGRRLEEVRRLVQGEDADKSLLVRVAVVERVQATMVGDLKDHREAVETKLQTILDCLEARQMENARTQTQVFLALIAVCASFLVAAGTALITLLRHP